MTSWKLRRLVNRLTDDGRVVRAKDEGDRARLAGEKSRQRRRTAALELGELGDAEAVQPLVDALEAEIWGEVVEAIASALAEIGDDRAVAPLVHKLLHLGNVVAPGEHERPAEAITRAIVSFGDAAVGLLGEALPSRRAAHALALIGSAEAAEAVVSRVPGAEELAGHTASGGDDVNLARALGEIDARLAPDTPARARVDDALVRMLVHARYYETRVIARQGLGAWQPASARDAVWSLIATIEHDQVARSGAYDFPEYAMSDEDPDEDPREGVPLWATTIMSSLLETWGDGIVAELVAALDRDDVVCRATLTKLVWATAAAGRLDASAIGPLMRVALATKYFEGYYATCALINIDDEAARPALEKIAATEGEVTVMVDDPDQFQSIGYQKQPNTAQRAIARAALDRRWNVFH